MKTIFAQEPLDWTGPAIFLAGPTLRARTTICPSAYHGVANVSDAPCFRCDDTGLIKLRSWREDALTYLANSGLTVLAPEFRDWREWRDNGDDWAAQVEWEHNAMDDPRVVLLFWVPRNMKTLPGLTTNVEFGYYLVKRPHAMVVGWPNGAEHVRYFREKARLYSMTGSIDYLGFHATLEDTCRAALKRTELLGY